MELGGGLGDEELDDAVGVGVGVGAGCGGGEETPSVARERAGPSMENEVGEFGRVRQSCASSGPRLAARLPDPVRIAIRSTGAIVRFEQVSKRSTWRDYGVLESDLPGEMVSAVGAAVVVYEEMD